MLLGLMAVFNEGDILADCLRYHIAAGFQFLILDNGSTDGSRETAESFLGHGVLGVRVLATDTYRWAYLLDTLLEWAETCEPSWCFLIDADTFLETPWSNTPWPAAVGRVEGEGYNVINFDHFEFWPVGDELASEPDIRRRIRYYTWADDHQEKGWKATRGARNSRFGGHSIDLPPGVSKRIYPCNFVLRHYRIRSYEHGLRKVFTERLPRFTGEPVNWHTHYAGFGRERQFFEIPKTLLSKRTEGEPWDKRPRFHGWEFKRMPANPDQAHTPSERSDT